MMTHGNLINRVLETSIPIVPVVGMGATECCWSDRHAYTVIAVSPTGKTCTVQRDHAIRTDNYGMSDCQDYRYERDPEGSTMTLRLTKRGWSSKGTRFILGSRDEHHDYSF